MLVPTHIPGVSVKRSKHGVQHRLRRGCNYAEFAYASDEASHAPARASLIALIDPKPLIRESILGMLGASLPEHRKVLGVSSFEELLERAKAEALRDSDGDLDLVILYIRSAGVNNNWVQEQLQLIKAQRPEMPVIMLSDRNDADDVIDALNCGVRGYIPTSIAAKVAIAALSVVEAGGTYVPADVLRHEGPAIESNGNAAHEPGELSLTSRELAVIDLLRLGNANKVIAIKLNLRESTVKVHVRNILKKLRVSNRTHAATVANRLLANPHLIARTNTIRRDGLH
jgi:DNA-binding NarL/FixJ family response regulator